MKPLFLTLVVLGLTGGVLYIAFLAKAPETKQNKMPNTQSQGNANQESPKDLQVEDLVVGTGAEAKQGSTVSVHYTGKLTDGVVFDSSYRRNTPFQFTLGRNSVIQGWEQGILGMKVGGKRKLTIPAHLGYGEQGAGNGAIPPNSTLIFEVDMLQVQ